MSQLYFLLFFIFSMSDDVFVEESAHSKDWYVDKHVEIIVGERGV